MWTNNWDMLWVSVGITEWGNKSTAFTVMSPTMSQIARCSLSMSSKMSSFSMSYFRGVDRYTMSNGNWSSISVGDDGMITIASMGFGVSKGISSFTCSYFWCIKRYAVWSNDWNMDWASIVTSIMSCICQRSNNTGIKSMSSTSIGFSMSSKMSNFCVRYFRSIKLISIVVKYRNMCCVPTSRNSGKAAGYNNL